MLRGYLWFFVIGQALLGECPDVHRLEVRSLPQILAHPFLGRVQQGTLLDFFADHDAEVNAGSFPLRLLRPLNRIESRDHPKVLDNFLSLRVLTARLHSDPIGGHDHLLCISPT
jgi:hypothetical protein